MQYQYYYAKHSHNSNVFTSNNCWWHKRTIGSMKFAVWWTLQMCRGIGKIQLCHYNLVWGKSGYFRWHTNDIYSSSFK